MRYLKIQNKGLLDIRLVSLMGGTTKQGQYKIGQFGTGLKYVLSYMFRNKLSLKIFIGKEKVEFSLKEEIIKDTIFEVLYINGERSSITTRMGLEWEAWMIVRELYSNALDEGDASYSVVQENEASGKEDTTSFFLEMSADFLQVYNNWNKYFIVNNLPMWENSMYAIHPADGKLTIYRQGILIYEHPTRNSVFNYDLKQGQINELREYKGTWEYDIAAVLYRIDDVKTIEYFLSHVSEKESAESFTNLDYDWTGEFNDAWKTCIGNAQIIHKEALDKLVGANPQADTSNLFVVPKKIYQALTRKFKGISVLRVIDKVNEFYEMYDAELELKLKQALVILETCNYFIHPELKFIYGDFGDKKVLAQINMDDKTIYISIKLKESSMFQFVAMLIEENEHFNTGFNDHTREFQQHFINLYTKQLLEKEAIKL